MPFGVIGMQYQDKAVAGPNESLQTKPENSKKIIVRCSPARANDTNDLSLNYSPVRKAVGAYTRAVNNLGKVWQE